MAARRHVKSRWYPGVTNANLRVQYFVKLKREWKSIDTADRSNDYERDLLDQKICLGGKSLSDNDKHI